MKESIVEMHLTFWFYGVQYKLVIIKSHQNPSIMLTQSNNIINPTDVAKGIAHKFNLFGDNILFVEDPLNPQRLPVAKQLGVNHMSDLAPYLPALPDDQAIATISSYCKVREGCDKIYALVFRLPKDSACPKGLTVNQKSDWLKERSGISDRHKGKFVVRTQDLPATDSHPVLLVFCEDLAMQLVLSGMKMMQMQVSCDPIVLTQHGKV